MIGGDLTKLSGKTLDTLKNTELIALNQDRMCRQLLQKNIAADPAVC